MLLLKTYGQSELGLYSAFRTKDFHGSLQVKDGDGALFKIFVLYLNGKCFRYQVPHTSKQPDEQPVPLAAGRLLVLM